MIIPLNSPSLSVSKVIIALENGLLMWTLANGLGIPYPIGQDTYVASRSQLPNTDSVCTNLTT